MDAESGGWSNLLRRGLSSVVTFLIIPALIFGIVALVLVARALATTFGDEVVSRGVLFVILGVIGFCCGKAAIETFKPTHWRGKTVYFALGMLGGYVAFFFVGLIGLMVGREYQRVRATGDYGGVIFLVLWFAVVPAVLWLADHVVGSIKRWFTDIIADAIRKSRNQ